MKRKLAGFLVFVLLLASVNLTAFAEGEEPDPGAEETPVSGTYRLSYDSCFYDEEPHAYVKVATGSNEPETKDPETRTGFENGEQLNFRLESPEEKEDSVPYVEVNEFTDENDWNIMEGKRSWDDEPGIVLSETETGVHTFSYTPGAEVKAFDINIWWSEFDWFGQEPLAGTEGEDPQPMCAFLELYSPAGDGQVRMEGDEGVQSFCYSRYVEEEGGGEHGEGDYKANIATPSRFKRLVFQPDENFVLDRVCFRWDGDISREVPLDELTAVEGGCYYDLTEDDWDENYRLCVEAYFAQEEDPGEGPRQQGESIADYIRDQKFVFGDWNKDGDVDQADLVDGIRDQIFYSGDAYRESRTYFGITAPSDIEITAEETGPAETLQVTDRNGTVHQLPVYDYEVVLTPTEESEPEEDRRTEGTETVTGKACLFAFTEEEFTEDTKDYYTYSETDLIMEAVSGETTVRRLVNARIINAEEEEERYTSPDVADLKTGKTGKDAQEGTIAVYAAYDVKKETDGVTRSVSVYGNGAALDAMFSREADTAFFAAQGRNENLVRDVNETRENEDRKLDQIFSSFTFIQPENRVVEVNGRGASGDTPAWAYGYSRFSSAAQKAAEALEVESYFGNTVYTFRPVLFGGDVKRISNLQPVGDVPAEALTIVAFDGAEEEDRRWEVRFNSDYYDEMTFRITYEMNDLNTEDRYIRLHRVGIDMEETAVSREAREEAEEAEEETAVITLMHGTTNGPDYEASLKAEKILYATYYYPEAENTTDYVGLYVTYTWKDGSVTRKYIENQPDLNMDREETAEDSCNCQTSDFILYEGKKETAPVKVEVIAITGESDEETFAGAKLGAGRGVKYTLSTEE